MGDQVLEKFQDLQKDDQVISYLITHLENTAKKIKGLSKNERKRLTRYTPFLFGSIKSLSDLNETIEHSKML
jgi:hypothetical protein